MQSPHCVEWLFIATSSETVRDSAKVITDQSPIGSRMYAFGWYRTTLDDLERPSHTLLALVVCKVLSVVSKRLRHS